MEEVVGLDSCCSEGGDEVEDDEDDDDDVDDVDDSFVSVFSSFFCEGASEEETEALPFSSDFGDEALSSLGTSSEERSSSGPARTPILVPTLMPLAPSCSWWERN